MRGPSLRLAAENGASVREEWRDIPGHTLVTVTLPREDVDGLWFGYGNMMEAFSHMLAAMNSAKAGDNDKVQRELDRAMGCLALVSSFAADVHRRAVESAERAKRRRPRGTAAST